MRLRWRSLQVRAPLVVALVVVAMPAFAWLSHLSDATAGRRVLLRVERTAQDATLLTSADQARALADLAARRGLRIRLFDPDGHTLLDADHDPPRGLARLGADLFFGPDGAPTLAAAEAGAPPVLARSFVLDARIEGQAATCETLAGGALLVCSAAVDLPDGRLLLVQESSRRAIRALYDVRYQLVKLTLSVLVVGLLLGAWLGWRMVGPVRELRRQVLDRTAASSTRPVELARDDELGDLAGAFNELLASLDARNRANEAFAADLVHELKNPVAAVRAAAESMAGAEAGLSPERAQRLARVLGDAGGRLDVLVSQFLELARAEAGLSAQDREPVDLAGLCAALVEAAAARWEGVDFQVAVDPARVLVVPERLETALRNLLDNAAAFAREGPGPPQVLLSMRADGDRAEVTVQDNGPGLDALARAHVFERFYSRRHGGTGLGLPLARAIALAHGGDLSVRDVPQGACFVLTLPLAGS